MKKKWLLIALSCVSALFMASCSSGNDELPTPPTQEPPVAKRIPISLNVGIVSLDRATDTGFETNDKIGLYVVNYKQGTPGVLQNTGNHVDNLAFTYNGTWNPEKQIYWKDDTTPADFYVYYPYGTPSDIAAYPFKVKADQSTLAAYKASDFLYGKAANVAPTEQAVSISTSHLFSCMQVKVAAGNGFTEQSLAAANVSVKLNGQKVEALINLKEGRAQVTGAASTVLPYKEGAVYKALVIPQTVTADNFITVTVDGRDYNLQKSFTFEKGKKYTFTATVSKVSNGINVGIEPWIEDSADHGGIAK